MAVARTEDRVVATGSRVAIRMGAEGEEEWTVVAPEDDPDPMQRRVSAAAPLGSALMGQRQGDTVRVRAPRTTYEVAIVHVY